MRIGTIVRMKDDPWKILGLIVEIRNRDTIKVKWMDDLCDPTFVDRWCLEIVCK